MSEDYDQFRSWYYEPLKTLETMPSGQGGFVAVATACFLYERYAVAILKSQGKKANRAGIVIQLSNDFEVDGETAEVFWKVIRDGILHQGMPLRSDDLPIWGFHDAYPALDLVINDNGPFLKVQPWKFTERVLQLWDDHFDMLKKSGAFPWATIGDVPA